MLFNLLADDLIQAVERVDGAKITMYADDACIFATHADPRIATNIVQRALKVAVDWGVENQLKFSPSKTKAMVFTRKNNIPRVPSLKLGDAAVEYVNRFKHLGLLVTRKLNWTQHVNWKCTLVKKSMMAHVNGTGKLWGYKPLIANYLWKGMGCPKLTYGCFLWYPMLEVYPGKVAQVRKVQNLSFRLTAPIRKKSPTRGLQILTHTPPLELQIRKLSTRTYLRTMKHQIFSDDEMATTCVTKVGHRQVISRYLEREGLSWLKQETDSILPIRKWNRLFSVDWDSMKRTTDKGKPITTNPWRFYCDGSKLEGDSAGSGLAVFRRDVPFDDLAWHLGKNATVFQSEVYALKQAAKWIIANKEMIVDEGCSIFIDSRATILAAIKPIVNQHSVKEATDLLDQAIAEHGISRIQIHWVKAHAGHAGNERADENAKEGASNPAWLSTDLPRLAKAVQNRQLEIKLLKDWTHDWVTNTSDNRQTRNWFPAGPVASFSHTLLRTPRITCGQLIQFFTGHNYLNRHKAIIAEKRRASQLARQARMEYLGLVLSSDEEETPIVVPDKKCDLCGEGEQTTEHIMTHCPKFASLRLSIFGNSQPQPPYCMPLPKIINFLKEAKIASLELYNTYEHWLKDNVDGDDSDIGPDNE